MYDPRHPKHLLRSFKNTFSGGSSCFYGLYIIYIYPGIPTTIQTMGVNITTIAHLRVLIIEMRSTIILMVVEAQGIYIYISSFSLATTTHSPGQTLEGHGHFMGSGSGAKHQWWTRGWREIGGDFLLSNRYVHIGSMGLIYFTYIYHRNQGNR